MVAFHYQNNPVYNLYISNSWNHDNDFAKLIDLLNTADDFQFICHFTQERDHMNRAQNERQLYEAVRKKMKHCSIVIMMCGVYSEYNKWINKEIILSKNELNKPLLAIEHLSSDRTSIIVKQNADRIVNWNAEAIVNAIRELA